MSDKSTQEIQKEENKTPEEENKIPPEMELKFSDNKHFPQEIKKKLSDTLQGKTENIEPTKMSSKLKEILDKDFGSGWCVVIGGHFSGAFTYIENYYIEISCKDVVIVVFKTYRPSK